LEAASFVVLFGAKAMSYGAKMERSATERPYSVGKNGA
jgi:hypothetical protein